MDDVNTQLSELRKWAEDVNAAYADGGYAAGDGPNPPDPDLILALVEVAEAAEKWAEAEGARSGNAGHVLVEALAALKEAT